MQVIPPIEITDARLTSSTVPEAVAATYSGATTYAAGDLAGAAPTYGSPQTVWRSLQSGNTGNAQTEGVWWTNAGIVYPVYTGDSCSIGAIVTDLATHSLYESLVDTNTFALNDVANDIKKWKYIGKTNRFRMFDYSRNQKTSAPGSITVALAPAKRINSIALSGMVANSYELTVTSVGGGGEVYSDSGSLNTRITTTWSDYFFGEFGTIPSLVYFDVPPFTDCIVTLTLTATSGNAQIGAIGVGTFIYVGETEQSTSEDILNFSTVDRDLDGNAILKPLRNVPKSRQTVLCEKNNLNKVRKLRNELNAASAFWYGLDDAAHAYFEAVSILGFYRGFEINTDFPDQAIINIEIEEV